MLFTAPFAYVGPLGRSLVVDMACATGASAVWMIEGYGFENGSATEVLAQPLCVHSGGIGVGGAGNWSFDPVKLSVGGALNYQLTGYPSNLPSLRANALCFGVSGPGGTWGGLALPFTLSSVAIPAPANCQWGSDVLATMPLTYATPLVPYPNRGVIQTVPAVPIPSIAALARLVFFTQVAAVDTNPLTSQPEVFPSHVVRWQIGAGTASPCAAVFASGSATAPTGTVYPGECASLRFQ